MRYLSRFPRHHNVAPTARFNRPRSHANSSSWSIQVRPIASSDDRQVHSTPQCKARLKTRELLVGLYHCTSCAFITVLMCSQLLGAVWDSITTETRFQYGRSPLLGPSQIVGTNDVPYADRVIACVGEGKFYEPKFVSSLLAEVGVSAILEDATGTAKHAYRIRQRHGGATAYRALDSIAQPIYETSCGLIASTIENIYAACSALGYTNLTWDYLRVLDEWDSNNLYALPNTLPILIMPFYDNSPYARHVIPTWGGDACIFRLENAYSGIAGGSTVATFRGINRSVHHGRTIEWLNRPHGLWKNGWYEDLEGMRWYSDVLSSANDAPYYAMNRVFDTRSGKELDCLRSDDCKPGYNDRWGDKFLSVGLMDSYSSVYVANGTEYGLFSYSAREIRTVRIVFDWETLLSNVCTGLILHRWVFAQLMLFSSAFRGQTHWSEGGISCIAGSRSFAMLPLVSLPHLKTTLTAFWSAGCKFEGPQSALADAWFAIYPSIAHLVLIYFSVLNTMGKILRRRVPDMLFAPTVAGLCLLHYFRHDLAQSGWLSGVDGRVGTVVLSAEMERLQLIDYFTTDFAWRVNGRVTFVFAVKIGLFVVNLLPLLLASSFPVRRKGSDLGLRGVEKAIALRVREVGGLANSQPYLLAVADCRFKRLLSRRFVVVVAPRGGDQEGHSASNSKKILPMTLITPITRLDTDAPATMKSHREVVLVNSYELIRLGYLVFGDIYLTTFQEWGRLSAMAPFRAFFHLWNHRVLVWRLRPLSTCGDAEIVGGRSLASSDPEMWRLDDPRLHDIRWWQVSACSIQC